MKRMVLGALVCIGLGMAIGEFGERGEVFAQRGQTPIPSGSAATVSSAPAPVAGSEMIVVPMLVADKGQILTMIDPRQKAMSVYHIDPAGKIELRSVRDLRWDFQAECINNASPQPNEIKAMLGQK
jgi:hypothetical protein